MPVKQRTANRSDPKEDQRKNPDALNDMIRNGLVRRLDPRPRFKCSDCNGVLVLRWGDSRRPHVAHLPTFREGTGRSCKTNPESLLHIVAKNAIANFLKTGGTLEILRTCKDCDRLSSIQLDPTKNVQVEGDLGNGLRGDVVVKDAANKVIYCIEVLNTHQTLTRPCEFYEILAADIVHLFDQDTNQKIWTLHDQRSYSCHRADCITLPALANQMGYFSNNTWRIPEVTVKHGWDDLLRRRKCIRCEKMWETKYGRPFCNTCFGETSQEKWQTKELEELAFALGYLTDIHGHLLNPCVVEVCLYMNAHFEWQRESSSEIPRNISFEIWKELKRRAQCIRCTSTSPIRFPRAYCRDCFYQLESGHGREKELMLFHEQEDRARIRKKYEWLREIALADRTAVCALCKGSPLVFWFGRREICYDCLERETLRGRTVRPQQMQSVPLSDLAEFNYDLTLVNT